MSSEQIEVSAERLNGLADKIDGLDLTAAERRVIDTVLERAATTEESEVAGFQLGLFVFPDGFPEPADLRPGGCKVAAACGIWEPDDGTFRV
ncbi:MAG: hypothetical protein ACR2OD_11465 [Gaiellaceae bacterium]